MSFLKHFSTSILLLGAIFIVKAMDDEAMPDVSQSPPVVYNMDSTATNLKFSSKIVEDTIPPCDIIFFKSGKIEYCKILEANPTTIIYKMCDYQDGPNIIVNKTAVHKIRYANGREEIVIPPSGQGDMNAHVRARKDPMSSWALASVLVGLLFTPLIIVGMLLGFFSLLRIKRSNGTLSGKGTAKAALIIGGILLLILLIYYI